MMARVNCYFLNDLDLGAREFLREEQGALGYTLAFRRAISVTEARTPILMIVLQIGGRIYSLHTHTAAYVNAAVMSNGV